jgi:hypothetical protein
MDSLWPSEISNYSETKSPVTILKEQGLELGKSTRNILIGEIIPYQIEQPNSKYGFSILAQPLNYRYVLFNITYNILDIYPVFMDLDIDIYKEVHKITYDILGKKDLIKFENENGFLFELRQIFNSERIKKIIKSLMVESGAIGLKKTGSTSSQID